MAPLIAPSAGSTSRSRRARASSGKFLDLDHHLHDPADRRVRGDAGNDRHDGAQQVGERGVVLGQRRLDAAQVGGDAMFDHGPEDVFLGREVEVERPLGDPGAGGDVVQPRGGEALLGEDLHRRGDDLVRSVGFAALELRLSGGKHLSRL